MPIFDMEKECRSTICQVSEFPITKAVLKIAYQAEKMAHENYVRYSQKAVEEKYANIAYLFTAFAASERIHAENYKRIRASMSTKPAEPMEIPSAT